MSYTTQHRTALIIFPLIPQTVIIAQTMSTGGEGENSHGKRTRSWSLKTLPMWAEPVADQLEHQSTTIKTERAVTSTAELLLYILCCSLHFQFQVQTRHHRHKEKRANRQRRKITQTTTQPDLKCIAATLIGASSVHRPYIR